MLMSGTLNAHLEEIDQAAEAMLEQLTTQMTERESVTEELKAADQLRWVQVMNNIWHQAEEIVRRELIEQGE